MTMIRSNTMSQRNSDKTKKDFRAYRRIYSRIAEIHRLIASGSYPSISKLAKTLEVTERTIKRDISALRNDHNAPIRYDRGRRGFYYTIPEWSLPVQRMQEGELLAFFIAENALKMTGHAPEAFRLKSALAKIATMLPDIVSINLATLGDIVRFQSPPHVDVDPLLLERLATYSMARETVEFDYFSPHSQKSSHRKADIHLLHNFAGDWYAISYDHDAGDFRDFHIGRISNLFGTGQYFHPQRNWNAEEYLRRGFQMMRGGRLTTVSISFDRYQAQWIRERKYFHPDEQRKNLPDGGLQLSFKVGEKGLDAVARFCLAYSGHCKIERPHKLREIVAAKIRDAIKLNDFQID